MRQRRPSDENGFVDDEQRAEKSRKCFVGMIDVSEVDSTSSAQLKCSEMF